MWTCADLKNDAKIALTGKYWTAFVACLIVFAIEAVGGSLSALIPFGPIALSFLIMTVLYVGLYRWFARSREAAATPAVEQVFALFKGETWSKTVGSMLWMYLFQFLWSLIALLPYLALLPFLIYSILIFTARDTQIPDFLVDYRTGALVLAIWILLVLLLSIPAIIKYYSYRMTPWILSDNPLIGHERALKLSIGLTRGHRWHMFVLDLSFLGWWLLGLLACGVGVLFVFPYYIATQAELYARLRQNGVLGQLCTMEELGYFPAGRQAD